MDNQSIISIVGLALTLVVNLCIVAYMQGRTVTQQQDFEKLFELNKKDVENHFKRLELKQDKHNNLIERMAIVEQSTKSAHHRLDSLQG
ncbi:MAG: hypothetical protein LUB59_00415 [Candidatus Gastranaerophilales bacterium]|nr:hypothetical protein [Candidatus Gastranaerophilales bacterium]